jgi:hypothetical protein
MTSYQCVCHFCGSMQCRYHCPLPYSSTMTVLDLMHRAGIEDNISFYGSSKK